MGLRHRQLSKKLKLDIPEPTIKTTPTYSSSSSSSSSSSNRKSLRNRLSGCFTNTSSCLRRATSCSIITPPSCMDRRRGSDSSVESITNEKPRYVHVPQHARQSYLASTSPQEFRDREYIDNVFIAPVQTDAQRAAEMRRMGRDRASRHGAQMFLVGSSRE